MIIVLPPGNWGLVPNSLYLGLNRTVFPCPMLLCHAQRPATSPEGQPPLSHFLVRGFSPLQNICITVNRHGVEGGGSTTQIWVHQVTDVGKEIWVGPERA